MVFRIFLTFQDIFGNDPTHCVHDTHSRPPPPAHSAHFAVLQQLYLSGCRLRDCGAAGDALLDHLLGRILGPHGIPFLATFWLGAEQMPALGAEVRRCGAVAAAWQRTPDNRISFQR